jgi:hypothetical protein
MKRLSPVLFSLVFALCSLHGQYGAPKDDTDEKQPAQPPEEIPDFNNLDEYIYQPRSNLNYGMRFNIGPKISFGGKGAISAPETTPDSTTPDLYRLYHDGVVAPDSRTLAVGNGTGTGSVPIAPDGKTNSWTYIDPTQLTSDDYMQFHIYSGTVSPISAVDERGKDNLGAEIYTSADMGSLGKRLKWSLFGGVSISDVAAATFSNVKGTLDTTTDTYNLFGQTPFTPTPGAPYTSPTTTTATIGAGTANAQTITITNETLISNAPVNRSFESVQNFDVTDHFKVSGAYFTFRGGPQLQYNFTDHLKAVVNVGAGLVYAGTNYTVSQVLQPPTGVEIVDIVSDGSSYFRLAAYADASLEYDVSDTTGFYLGAYYQDARGYDQHVYDGAGSDYTTRVDLSDQQGFRSGMTYRF